MSLLIFRIATNLHLLKDKRLILNFSIGEMQFSYGSLFNNSYGSLHLDQIVFGQKTQRIRFSYPRASYVISSEVN